LENIYKVGYLKRFEKKFPIESPKELNPFTIGVKGSQVAPPLGKSRFHPPRNKSGPMIIYKIINTPKNKTRRKGIVFRSSEDPLIAAPPG
jgi:hypothetical protein